MGKHLTRILAVCPAGFYAMGLILSSWELALTGMLLLWLFLAGVWIESYGAKHAWFLKLLGKCTNQMPVRVMDYIGKITYVLAKPLDRGVFEARLHDGRVGHLILLPNGFVDPRCGASFCYIWQPLDLRIRAQMVLSSRDEWPNWEEFGTMPHLRKIETREQAMSRG